MSQAHLEHTLPLVSSEIVLLVIIGSSVALFEISSIKFQNPQSAREWILLISMGVLGFILQFLLTAGLQLDNSTEASSMLYVQIIFAFAFDWGTLGVILVHGVCLVVLSVYAIHYGAHYRSQVGRLRSVLNQMRRVRCLARRLATTLTQGERS